ncbi:lysoplasmalogenase [Eucyclogobius newberryi]|uniref:lysoplasmalogenase n=1 Tax=Eucyclogobius newberryi TaxID=166745 RepID=UPI003B5AA8CB
MDILETDAYDRRQRRNMSCALFMHLVPFFVATSAYFYLWTPESVGSTVAAGVKSAPALLLAVVVLSWNGPLSILGVAGGLLFSAVGDFCLVFPDQMFIHGMAAFAVAHLLYSLTFLSSRYSNDSSSSWPRLFYPILLVTGGGFYFHLYPYLQKAPNPDLMVPAVGIYVVLITLMGSLAIRTRRLTTVLGSLVFMVSDISLAVQVFKVTVIEHGTVVVMVTYYLSQLLIAVGDVKAVEGKEDFSKWKRA